MISGYADYAVLEIEPLDITKVCIQADRGRFFFEGLRFDEPTPPDKPLVIRATAFRERGYRDCMAYEGKLLFRESPDDPSDAMVSSSTIRLHVYQSKLKMDVLPCKAGYQWETARLFLYGQSDRPAEVFAARSYRKGFHVEGPTPTGAFEITDEPTAEQVRHKGTTRVVLKVLDAAGKEHTQQATLATP